MKKLFLPVAAAFVLNVSGDGRPAPTAAQLARVDAEIEIYGIVHWGLNTFTDREWGYGDEDPALLSPAEFDAGQIVRASRDGGLQGLVVVAKHHDGFCLWPTKTTGHNISKSPFRGGKGDYVREMSDACRRYGLKFGVYCSPWDRNNAHYATPKYVEVYHAQIKELLGGAYGEVFEMWFDNANGGDGYYGGAREKRKIPYDYYRFGEVFRFVRELQPGICIFNEDDAADFRFPGNEQGILDPDCRATAAHYDITRDYREYMAWSNKGVKEGVRFHPPEADFPLRPGWFYHDSQRGKTKSGAFLMKRYLNTVGNGGTMNIGLAPDRRGLLCDEDVRALRHFGEIKKAFFAKPVAEGLCNVVVMREDVARGERVDSWKLLSRGEEVDSGKSIGIKRIRVLPRAVAAETLRLEVKSDTEIAPKVLSMRFYRADETLLSLIEKAEADSGETDTAKWMNAERMSGVKNPRFKPIEIPGLEPKPDFWKVRPREIAEVCESAVKCSRKEIICRTPLGYPVWALFYGDFSEAPPQTNWSAGQGSTTYRNYYGRAQGGKQTFLFVAGVHGAEPECVAGAVNIVKLLESGRDFRGRENPQLLSLLKNYRFIVVPCVNMDGRAISPDHLRKVDWVTFRKASQGYWADGSLVGWRGSKSYFPLPLDKVGYPGGYPNAEGYNIMHDACPGDIRTEEARALLKLAARWRVDAVLNGHSYENAPSVIMPSAVDNPSTLKRARDIRYRCNQALRRAGLAVWDFVPPEKDAPSKPGINLNTMLSLASGALALTLECTVSYDRPDRPGAKNKPARLYSFEEMVDVTYVTLQEFLASGLEQPFLNRGPETVSAD